MGSNGHINEALEAIDRAIARVFTGDLAAPSANTFALFDPVLSALLNTSTIRTFAVSPNEELLQAGKGIQSELPSFTYAVASYFSPTDLGRHSVVQTDNGSGDRLRSKAAISLFFAISHRAGYGDDHIYSTDELYTATHFLVRFAKRKCSVPLEFSNKTSVVVDQAAWRIPIANKAKLLGALGWNELLNQLVSKFKADPADADALTDAAITHIPTTYDARIAEMGAEAIRRYRAAVQDNPQLVDDLGGANGPALSRMWDAQLSLSQAAFMTASYLLWHESVPDTNWAYTFPSHAHKTCCVLTAGTKRILGVSHLALLAWISRTVFVHPLIRDYADKLSKDLVEQRVAVLRTINEHDINTVLINPARNLLSWIKTGLVAARSPDRDGTSKLITGALLDAEAMDQLLDLYRPFFQPATVGAQQSTRDFVGQRTTEVNLASIRETIDLVFHRVIVRFQGRSIARHMKLSWVNFEGQIRCDHEMLTSVLLNLVRNAVKHAAPHAIFDNHARGIIEINYQGDGPGHGRITVQDHASGIKESALPAIRGRIAKIEQVDEASLSTVANSLLTQAAINRSGRGFVICAFLLRQSELGIEKEQGRLTVQNSLDGLAVSARFPIYE